MTRSDPGASEPELPDHDADRPGPGGPDGQQSGPGRDDAVWLDLVARLEGTDSGQPDEGPAVPAAGTTAGGAPGGRSFKDFDPLGLAAPAPAPQVPEAPEGPRDYAVDDDDDGVFVPEEPPSLAGTDPLTMLAWLGAVGGPIALLLSAMFWRNAPLLAVVGMVVAFAVSVVFLIMKLPHEKDEYDDGARL